MQRIRLSNTSDMIIQDNSTKSAEISIQDRLESNVGSVQLQTTNKENGDLIEKEFDYYERHQIHGPLLTKLYDALLSVQPTSTQSERNFSLAASITTKKISRLSSEKLNASCFLKSFFTKNP